MPGVAGQSAIEGSAGGRLASPGALGQVVRVWRAALPPQCAEGRRSKSRNIRIKNSGRQETRYVRVF